MPVPKGLEPTGVILADKPAGPSSFAIVARVRSRTGAKTGHAGTLDPFATGLLILLSGRATSLQDRFMKLDKRYLTEVDLSLRTTTGDPEGDPLEPHEPPSPDELEQALDALRGEVELPIPAASAVKIDGTRAYRLHRQGVDVAMPTRVMRVHRLELLAYEGGVARLDLDVGSGTYVRSLADALGGHCVTLRRTEIGPFRVEEADEMRVLSLEEALPRLAAVRGQAR
jgi:tRNA pseudouridine55 synthase